MNILKQIAAALSLHRAFQAAFAELNRLSDRELSDLGLSRGDVVRVAFEEAERRTAARTPGRSAARAADDGRVAAPWTGEDVQGDVAR